MHVLQWENQISMQISLKLDKICIVDFFIDLEAYTTFFVSLAIWFVKISLSRRLYWSRFCEQKMAMKDTVGKTNIICLENGVFIARRCCVCILAISDAEHNGTRLD